ncbi:MAG: AI-2E family transporter [Pleurocapsa sp.]
MGSQKWLGLIALAIAVLILWQIKQVLLLAFAAVVFATVINRLVRLLQKWQIKRGFAIVVAVTAILIVLFGLFALVIPAFLDQIQELVKLLPTGIDQLRNWVGGLHRLLPQRFVSGLENLEQMAQNQLQKWADGLIDNFFSVFSGTLNVALNSLLVIVVTIMFLANPQPYRQIFLLLFPAFYRSRVDEILDECEINLSGWAIGILFNMTVITFLSGIGLLILDVRLPFANALLAGLFTFIPNLGPTLSVIPPTILALIDAPWKAIAVIVLYIIIQQVEGTVLTPVVMQKQVSLLPAITILSQIAFAAFFGIFGLFLALPIIVVAMVWFKKVLIEDFLNQWQTSKAKN